MSQYPHPPYQPPAALPYGGYPYPGFDDALAPAKRAGWMMLFLGALVCLFGACFLFMGMAFPQLQAQMPPQQQQVFQQIESSTRLPVGTILVIVGVIALVPGVLQIVLSFFVRKGGTGAIVSGIVVGGLLTLWFAFNTLGAVARVATTGPAGAPGVCVVGVALALFITEVVMLVSALRAVPRVRAMRQQPYGYPPPAGAWQQPYGHPPAQGYGYATQPPPPPPPPANPPSE